MFTYMDNNNNYIYAQNMIFETSTSGTWALTQTTDPNIKGAEKGSLRFEPILNQTLLAYLRLFKTFVWHYEMPLLSIGSGTFFAYFLENRYTFDLKIIQGMKVGLGLN